MLKALESSRNVIRHQLTELLKLKHSPELKFFYDRGAENAIEVDTILHQIAVPPQ